MARLFLFNILIKRGVHLITKFIECMFFLVMLAVAGISVFVDAFLHACASGKYKIVLTGHLLSA